MHRGRHYDRAGQAPKTGAKPKAQQVWPIRDTQQRGACTMGRLGATKGGIRAGGATGGGTRETTWLVLLPDLHRGRRAVGVVLKTQKNT